MHYAMRKLGLQALVQEMHTGGDQTNHQEFAGQSYSVLVSDDILMLERSTLAGDERTRLTIILFVLPFPESAPVCNETAVEFLITEQVLSHAISPGSPLVLTH